MGAVGELRAKISLGGMNEVQSQLKKFSQSMQKASEDISALGDRLKEAGEHFNEIGENLTPLTVGLTAVGVAGVTAYDNINQGISIFQTKLGASGVELAKYENIMKQVAVTGVGSFEEVSNAIVTATQNMKGLSDKEIATITEEAMQLANVMDTEVGEVTKVAGMLMTQFGIDGSTALDMIAKGYQKGLDYAGDYMDTLQEYSVHFKSLGFSAQDMFNILIEGAKKGAFNLDKVGDAVKEFNIRSKDGSDTTIQALKSLGFNADKMMHTFANGGEGAKKAFMQVVQALAKVDDQQKRNVIGVSLFGTMYEDLEKDVIASMGAIKDHMKGFEGTASEVAKSNKTFAKEMQGYWNEIQIAIKPVGDILKQAVLDVMPYVVSVVKSLSSAFSNLSPTMQKVVIAVGAFVALLPTLIIGLGSLTTLSGTFMSGLSVLTKGFSLLSNGFVRLIGTFKTIIKGIGIISRVFMANPFMLLVVGIAVVATLIIMHWDKIKAYTISVWNSIKDWFAPYWASFKDMVASVVQGFINTWNRVKSFFVTLWTDIVKVVSASWNAIKNAFLIGVGIILTLIAPIWNAYATVFNAVGSIVANVWNRIKEGASSLWSAIKEGLNRVRAFFSSVWDAISSVVASAISMIKSIVHTLISTATSVVNKVKSVFRSAWTFIYSSVISPVIRRIISLVNTLASMAKTVGSIIKDAFISTWNGIKDSVGSVISSIKNKISSIWSTASSIASMIKSAFSSIFKGIKIPKFSLKGKFSLMPPSVPKISVSWNAKGGILDSATLIGAGEKGAEAIVPLSSQRRMKPFAQAVARFMPDGSRGNVTNNFHISQLVVREQADVQRIAQELNRLQERKERARGGLSFNG